MGRHGGRRHVPIPPNDNYNFFFRNTCGKFNKFNSVNYVAQPNYSQQDVDAVFQHINKEYTTSPWLSCGFLIFVSCILLGALVMDGKYMLYFFILGYGGMFILCCYICISAC